MMNRFERAGKALEKLCGIMAQLRAPDGCPWDREQTLDSLKPYLIEEAYETIEALESGDSAAHCEELGDLLLQAVFQAELRQEQDQFDMADVADAISSKLIRRHPHVFGDSKADDADGALKSWESVKALERKHGKSALDGIPATLPALLRAMRASEKAAAVGFDWQDREGIHDKLEEEHAELREALEAGSSADSIREELGDYLFALVNLARHLRVDPEAALREATAKFQRRFRQIENRLAAKDRTPADESLESLEQLWAEVKASERS